MDRIQQHIDIARAWFRAFNTQDIGTLLSLYDDEASHYSPKLKLRSPGTGGYVSGKKALREWWEDAFNRLPELHYAPSSFTANEDRVFLEYLRQVPGEPDMLVAEVLEMKDGLIMASRVYHG